MLGSSKMIRRSVVGAALCAGSVVALVEPLALPISVRRGCCSVGHSAMTSPALRTSVVKDVHRLSGGAQAQTHTSLRCAEEDSGIGERLVAVKERVKACQQNGAEVQLVAVSKFQSNHAILAAYAAGQRVFGENYVQELVSKAPDLPADIRWHFIGMLQSNKAKGLVAGGKFSRFSLPLKTAANDHQTDFLRIFNSAQPRSG